jgi:WD40 repeat protein
MELNPQQEVAIPEFFDESDSEEKNIIATFNFNSSVLAVAISPNGKLIAVGLDNGTIEIWDLVLKNKLVSWTGHKSRVTSVAFSPDGTKIVSGSRDNTVQLWNLQGEPTAPPFQGNYSEVESVQSPLVLMAQRLSVAVVTRQYDCGISQNNRITALPKLFATTNPQAKTRLM